MSFAVRPAAVALFLLGAAIPHWALAALPPGTSVLYRYISAPLDTVTYDSAYQSGPITEPASPPKRFIADFVLSDYLPTGQDTSLTSLLVKADFYLMGTTPATAGISNSMSYPGGGPGKASTLSGVLGLDQAGNVTQWSFVANASEEGNEDGPYMYGPYAIGFTSSFGREGQDTDYQTWASARAYNRWFNLGQAGTWSVSTVPTPTPAVPEASTVACAIAGLAAVGALGRRRNLRPAR